MVYMKISVCYQNKGASYFIVSTIYINFFTRKMKKLYLNVQYFRFFKTFFFILFNIKIKFVAVFKRSENMGTCYATVMADVCIWCYL